MGRTVRELTYVPVILVRMAPPAGTSQTMTTSVYVQRVTMVTHVRSTTLAITLTVRMEGSVKTPPRPVTRASVPILTWAIFVNIITVVTNLPVNMDSVVWMQMASTVVSVS